MLLFVSKFSSMVFVSVLNIYYCFWFNGVQDVVVLVDGFGYVCEGFFSSDFVIKLLCGDVLKPL